MSHPTNLAAGRWLLLFACAVLTGIASWPLTDAELPPAPSLQVDLQPRAPATASGGAPGDATPIAAPTPQLHRQLADSSTAPGISGRLLQDDQPCAFAEVRGDDAVHCTSAADGTFFLPLPAGDHRLAITGAAIPPGFDFHPVSLAAAEHCDLGIILVPRGASVQGRVVDEQERPLAGVRVYASRAGALEYPLDQGAAETSPSVLTGADGCFQMHDLLPGELVVTAEHPDFAVGDDGRCAQPDLASGGSTDVGDLELRRAELLAGCVFDRFGRAVGNALVTPGGDDYAALRPRRATRTAADGGFLLHGFCRRSVLTVAADGFESLTCDAVDAAPRPLRIVLQPALVLMGTVQGISAQAGFVGVSPDPESCQELPAWVGGILRAPHPVAADGSFRIVGLPAGTWRVCANVPGVGSAAPVSCEVPQREPLLLTIVPPQAVAVQVVDDLGSPLAGARLSHWLARVAEDLPGIACAPTAAMQELVAGVDGRVVLQLTPHQGLTLLGEAPGHCSDRLDLEPGAVPASATLVLPRAGVLHGRTAAAAVTAHAYLWLHCQRLETERGCSFDVDSTGSFRSGPLLPGRYALTLVLADARIVSSWRHPVARPLPLLGERAEVSEPVEVEVRAGDDTAVELPAPGYGELHGRVLASGVPVAGAVVFAGAGDAEQLSCLLPVDPYQDGSRVVSHADAEGRFRLLAPAAAAVQVRARHALGAAWSAPVVVTLTKGASVQRDLRLYAAAIRGRLDVSAMAPSERRQLRVLLCPQPYAAMNPRDPIETVDGNMSVGRAVQRVALDQTGTFAFECLPPGGWVLRLLHCGDLAQQRVLHTVADELLDLGQLAAPAEVKPDLGCGLTKAHAVEVRQVVDGAEVFVRVLFGGDGGGIDWRPLQPGSYRLQARCVREDSYGATRRSWPLGDRVGGPVEVEVHKDGSCTPSVVWPGGIEK